MATDPWGAMGMDGPKPADPPRKTASAAASAPTSIPLVDDGLNNLKPRGPRICH